MPLLGHVRYACNDLLGPNVGLSCFSTFDCLFILTGTKYMKYKLETSV